MTVEREDLRDELLAVLAARRELAPENEKYLVEGFLSRLDQEIDARIEAKLASRPRPRHRGDAWVVPASLALAIPITAIAGGIARGPGLLMAWVGILVVLGLYYVMRDR